MRTPVFRRPPLLARIVTVAALLVCLPGVPAVAATGGAERVRAASLEWGVNPIYQGATAGGTNCSFFSAEAGPGFVAKQGNVRIIHRLGDGSAVRISAGTRCLPSQGQRLNQRVLFSNGTGTADPATGRATIRWTGAFTANAYSGLVTWWLKNPTLVVGPGGKGLITATAGGNGAQMSDPENQSPVPDRRVTIAEFDSVSVTEHGIRIDGNYAGVDYFPLVDGVRSTESAIPAEAKSANPGWGSWPQSFVDFQYETNLSSYWHTSGLSADPDKPPYPMDVRFDSAPPIQEVPAFTDTPTTTATSPFIEGRPVTFTAAVEDADQLSWERGTAANGPWTPIEGATEAGFTIPAVSSAWNGAHLRLTARNAHGTASSIPVRIQTVPRTPLTFTAAPKPVTAIADTAAAVDFTVTGHPKVDPEAVTLERSTDGGTQWQPWTEVEYTPVNSSGTGRFVITRIPLTADGTLVRVRAVSLDGEAVSSGPAPVRVFPNTGANQIVVLPDSQIDPTTDNRLSVLGANFSIPEGQTNRSYSLDLGVFEQTQWQPGRPAHRDWLVTSTETSGGQLYKGALDATGGTFSATITIPAGKLDPTKQYGIATFLRLTDSSTWEDTFTERSADSWTPLKLNP